MIRCLLTVFFLLWIACCATQPDPTFSPESTRNPVALGNILDLRGQYQRHFFRKEFATCPVCQGKRCEFCQQQGVLLGYIDWTYGYAYVPGLGLEPGIGPQQTLKAKRAAEVVCHRYAIELLSELALAENMNLDSQIAEDIYSRSLKDSERIQEDTQKKLDQKLTVATMRLKIPLFGPSGLMHHLYSFYENRHQSEPFLGEFGTEESYSHLVLDARGKRLNPAFFPKIRTTSGAVLFDFSTVNQSTIQERGAVIYVATVSSSKAQEIQNYLEAPSRSSSRSGGNVPLEISVHANTNAYQVDLVVSEEVAHKILANGRLLKTGQIFVLIDP